MRQNAIFAFGNLTTLALSYAYHFLSGRLLGPRAYAPIAAIVSLYFLILVPGQMVLTVAMSYTATFRASGQGTQVRALFRSLTKLAAIVSLAVTGLLTVLSPLIAGFLQIRLATVLALAPAVFLVLLASVNRGLLQGEQRFLVLSGLLVMDAGAKAIFAVILIVWGFGATGAVLALGIGLALSYIASFWPLRHLLSGSTAGVDVRHVLRFALPTTATVFGITFLYTADVLLVKHFLDPEHAGIYGSVSALGKVVFLATVSVTGVMFPRVISLEAHGHSGARTLGVSAVAIVVIAMGIVLIFTAVPNFVLLPFGPAFAAAAPYLPAFGIAAGLFSLANLLSNYLLAVRDERFVPILALAGIAEIVMIWNFHANLWQVIWSLLAIGAATLGALWAISLTRGTPAPG